MQKTTNSSELSDFCPSCTIFVSNLRSFPNFIFNDILIFNTSLKKKSFNLLAQFLLNVLSIPHSNSYIEQFSQVNIIKSEKRNLLLEVSTVSSLLQVKSYYSELNEKDHYFEPSEKDFYFYNNNICSRNV